MSRGLSEPMANAIRAVESLSRDPITGAQNVQQELLWMRQLLALQRETKERIEMLETYACDARIAAANAVDEVKRRIELLEMALPEPDPEDPHEAGIPA